MHLAYTLVLPFVLFSSYAIGGHTDRATSHIKASSVVANRQYHPTRALIDVCIGLDTDVLVSRILDEINLPLPGLIPGLLDAGVNGPLCLCIKDLDIFLKTHIVAQVFSKIIGDDPLTVILKTIIGDRGEQCTFPDHAEPAKVCSADDPCGFECRDGYIRKGNACVCPPPQIECNGVCGGSSNQCGSAVPRSLKMRRSTISSYFEAEKICLEGETVCGIQGTLGWECRPSSLAHSDSCPTPPFNDSPPTTFHPDVKARNNKDEIVLLIDKTLKSIGFASSAQASLSYTPSDGSLDPLLQQVVDLVTHLGISLNSILTPGTCDDLIATTNRLIDAIGCALGIPDLAEGTEQTLQDLLFTTNVLLDSLTTLKPMVESCGCSESPDLLQSVNDLLARSHIPTLDSLIPPLTKRSNRLQYHNVKKQILTGSLLNDDMNVTKLNDLDLDTLLHKAGLNALGQPKRRVDPADLELGTLDNSSTIVLFRSLFGAHQLSKQISANSEKLASNCNCSGDPDSLDSVGRATLNIVELMNQVFSGINPLLAQFNDVSCTNVIHQLNLLSIELAKSLNYGGIDSLTRQTLVDAENSTNGLLEYLNNLLALDYSCGCVEHVVSSASNRR